MLTYWSALLTKGDSNHSGTSFQLGSSVLSKFGRGTCGRMLEEREKKERREREEREKRERREREEEKKRTIILVLIKQITETPQCPSSVIYHTHDGTRG